MGLLDFFNGSGEDPKVAMLVDTNHKLTTQMTTLLSNYSDQIVDIKHRVDELEALIHGKG